MKNLFLSIIAMISFAFGAQALAQDRPTLKVGDTRSYVKETPRGLLLEEITYIVTEVTPSGYTIKRTSSTQGEESYSITQNLGQNSPIQGRQGDGNLYDFPLTQGKSWTSESYRASSDGGVVFEKMTYTVVGEETVTVPAGTFRAIKIEGSGNWRQGNFGGMLQSVSWFSMEVKNHVQREQIRYSSSGKATPDVMKLTSYKHGN